MFKLICVWLTQDLDDYIDILFSYYPVIFNINIKFRIKHLFMQAKLNGYFFVIISKVILTNFQI